MISSRAGGICELLEHERNSLMIEDPEDSAELAGHVRRLLKDRGLARRLPLEGRKLASSAHEMRTLSGQPI